MHNFMIDTSLQVLSDNYAYVPSREVAETVEKMLPRVWDLAPSSLFDFCIRAHAGTRVTKTICTSEHYNTHLNKLQSSLIYPPALWVNSIASTLKPTHHIVRIILNNGLQYNDSYMYTGNIHTCTRVYSGKLGEEGFKNRDCFCVPCQEIAIPLTGWGQMQITRLIFKWTHKIIVCKK